MIRFPSGDDEDKGLPEEQRFYYLRLMAKPSDDKREPIKTKFVRWAPPCPQQNSVETDQDLESQAMRVVRTIGQAFEVCHKVAQEQMQEKHQEDSESGINVRGKSSVVSIEGDHGEMEEKLPKVSEASRSPSPTDNPPPPAPAAPAYLQKRHSIFVPRKASEAAVSSSTAMEAAASSTVAALKDYSQPSTSGEQQKLPSGPALQMQQLSTAASGNSTAAASNPAPSASGSSTLPHSMTWGPQMTAGQFQSMQSLDQRGLPAIPFYPMPMVGPSASMPYGLSSPYLLSPYATMQLPRNTSEQQIPANPNIPGSPPEGQDLTAYQLSLSLDQYNQHLIRSQLDQAQQTAQVASCQVQLLRDQLTSETTARIEAQSRTHQLLNANRELLEQVQALVLRLQSLEARLAEEIQEHITQPSTSKGHPSSATLPKAASAAASRPALQMASHSFHEQYTGEAKVPGPPPIDPSKPYQLQSLADIRAGSLPPQGAEAATSSSTKNRRAADDSGIRTEPESGAEDTTDYSSSDQYEKVPSVKIAQQRPAPPPAPPGPHLNILMSNPQVMPNLSSFFSSQPPLPGTYVPDYLAYTTARSQNAEVSKGDEDQQIASPTGRRTREKILGGETMFNRMSFNPKLREGKRKEASDTFDSPVMESIEESQSEQPRTIDERRKTVEDISIRRRRSEKLERYGISEEPETSITEERLEDIGGVEKPDKLESPRRKSVPSGTVALEPASLHVATAMYPPRRLTPMRSAISKVVSPKKTMLRALSVDIRDDDVPTSLLQQQYQPPLLMGNGPISPSRPGPLLANHIGMLGEKEKSSIQKPGASGLSQMLVLQEALKHGLASTRQQLRKTSETLDGMRSPRRYVESQKLGDPTVLAKLTKIPTFRSGGDLSEKTRESTTNPGASPKPAASSSTTATGQSETARKSDTGNP